MPARSARSCLVPGLGLALAGGLVGLALVDRQPAPPPAWHVAEAQRGEELARGGDDRVPAAPAFAAPVAPTPEEAAEFGRLLDRLGAALTKGDAAAVVAQFDADRMADEFARTGALDKVPGGRAKGARAAFARAVRQGLGTTLAANELFRWDRSEVRRVRWSPDRSEAVVIAVHRSDAAADLSFKARWWVVARPGGCTTSRSWPSGTGSRTCWGRS